MAVVEVMTGWWGELSVHVTVGGDCVDREGIFVCGYRRHSWTHAVRGYWIPDDVAETAPDPFAEPDEIEAAPPEWPLPANEEGDPPAGIPFFVPFGAASVPRCRSP